MMKILPLNIINNNISFKSFEEDTNLVGKSEFIAGRYNHHTSFIRNFPTLKFVSNYLKYNFPAGTHIAEFGCSQGQKPYSLLIMLDSFNQDKRYTITGYDIPNVIKSAKQGIYRLDFADKNEQEIFNEKFGLKNTFFEYFDEIKRWKTKESTFVTPNSKKTKGLIEFKVGNILNIDKILEPKKSGVIIFQNALYHIFDICEKINDDKLNTVKELFTKIYDTLPNKGIFVLGSLTTDHVLEDTDRINFTLKYQNNQRIKVYDSSKIHNHLREVGFEPIFYEKAALHIVNPAFEDVYLPAVWQKTLKR